MYPMWICTFQTNFLAAEKVFRPLFHPSPVPLGEKQGSFTLLAGNVQVLYCKCFFNLVNAYAMNLGLGCLMSDTDEKALLWDTVAWMCKVT